MGVRRVVSTVGATDLSEGVKMENINKKIPKTIYVSSIFQNTRGFEKKKKKKTKPMRGKITLL